MDRQVRVCELVGWYPSNQPFPDPSIPEHSVGVLTFTTRTGDVFGECMHQSSELAAKNYG